MSNKSNKKGNAKPVVRKPKEEKTETVEKESIMVELTEAPKTELTEEVKDFVEEFPEFANEVVEEVVEAKPVDPEVFETKLFVEEEPEAVIFAAPIPDELGEVTELPEKDCVCEEPCTEPCTCEAPTLEEQPNQGCVDTLPLETSLEIEDFLTEEQIEEGAQVVADMVNDQILNELKALAPEPPKVKSLASLSNAELRHFRRTGQMPK